MNKKIIIGTRASKLALLYAEKAKNKILEKSDLKSEDIIIKKISTKGDEIQEIRLSEFGGKGLFLSTIEEELQNKNIDIAVHALKDMPAFETEGLKTDSFLERADAREVLITSENIKFKMLKSNSIIGTSSYRREFQIKKIRPDLNCRLIRGNVDTRIKKLKDGKYDGIILSYAGLLHLKLEKEISEIFSVNEIIPSAGQGIIALQCREQDQQIATLLKEINHHETFIKAHTERNILKVLEGDCETAVGVHSIINGDKITVQAELFSLDGSQRYYEKKSIEKAKFKELGNEVGKSLKIKSKNNYKK